MTIEEARKLLEAANVFYYNESEKECADSWPEESQILNQNDVWGWAMSWGEKIQDEELPEVAMLFSNYGWCGLLYWTSEKHNQMRSEFEDNNRYIDFVRNEERIRKEVPDHNKRAYHKESYILPSPSVESEGKE